jgi:hypothetical protein
MRQGTMACADAAKEYRNKRRQDDLLQLITDSQLPEKKKSRSKNWPSRRAFCDCGNEATVAKYNTRICQRCFDWDNNRAKDRWDGTASSVGGLEEHRIGNPSKKPDRSSID